MKKCITTVYYLVDNFYEIYQEWEQNKLLPSDKKRFRQENLKLLKV
ncbi:MAG: hypothetical protein LN561_01705 [Rickettsia endosymbiont of Labidopullus appendiculatus]|nr:hypothetical protein [Rickettsia endosymbiont of Labidopullus appendiculatus]